MIQKMVIIMLFFSLILGCKKQQPAQENVENFSEGVITKDTFYYKTGSLDNYGGKLLRGQKISIGKKSVSIDKNNLKHVLNEIQLPGDDKTYWVIAKFVLKNGHEISNIYKAPRKIFTIAKDTHYYKIPDIQSQRFEIQAGIKTLLLEERSEWAKVHLGNGEFWMKMEDLSSADVNYELKRYFSGLGTGIITSSSSFSGALGLERLFSPDKAFDGNLKTAWLEGNDNIGVGEWIKIDFKTGNFKFSLAIVNGFAANENTYKAKARIKKLRIETEAGTKSFDLEDNRMDFQELGNFEGNWVKFIIDEVYPGTERDAAIGEIQIKHLSTIAEGTSQQNIPNSGQ